MKRLSQVKVICFYTLNTPYEQEVIDLKESCLRYKIPLDLEGIPSYGSWEKNVAMKPKFMLEKLKKSTGPLLWVDADAAFLQKPDFSLFMNSDLSVRFMEIFQDDPRYFVNTATVFINKTEAAQTLLERWVRRCEEITEMDGIPPCTDQIALYDVLKDNETATIFPMPVSYCKIFDIDSFFINDTDVVIEQRQASRRYKTC